MDQKKSYRFLLPQVASEPLGTQGEIAEFIPYRLDEGITPESILEELRSQPHFKALADYISPDRKLYLLESSKLELLQLAAEYIGTYHRLVNEYGDCYTEESSDDLEDDEEEEESWQRGDANVTAFDFSARLPFLDENDLSRFYDDDEGFGFGHNAYMANQNTRSRPWWTMNLTAPLAITACGPLNNIPDLMRHLSQRSLVILLYRNTPFHRHPFALADDYIPCHMTLTDLSFELETEMYTIEPPKSTSPYKCNVLAQLSREKGAPLSPSADPGRILRLVENSRGNVDNRTLSRAVSNALLRKKGATELTVKDFRYLSTLFSSQKKTSSRQREAPLVGQDEVRCQLEGIVDSMAFQKRRRALGLPSDTIHYTFAFLGAPGTGKTTWALRLADQMAKRGLLHNTESICINAAELKAKYVGHTTGKVKALFDQYGVIILDEAYSLDEGDSFGAEALSQLCVELENHAGDRLVVFAGYGGSDDPNDNRMLRFLRSNPGINSRVAFKVHFKNFTAGELTQVFHSMMEHSSYILPPRCDESLDRFFAERMKQKAFGNCREVRNLVDRVKLLMAARLAGMKKCSKAEACRVLEEDILRAIREISLEYRGLERNAGAPIGFGT